MHQHFLSARNAVLLALLAALAWLFILLSLLPPLAAHSKPQVHAAPIFMPQ
ncbi:hypothetical protein [Collimonas humicola]|uniref:hypothetical protein n=1 Tax=Collimonas humicola TaxID=2825886 RepID=UPI001B8B6AC0|nr:hypothetical protein [Collimonas humicola]